jgi:hypothetical protein
MAFSLSRLEPFVKNIWAILKYRVEEGSQIIGRIRAIDIGGMERFRAVYYS